MREIPCISLSFIEENNVIAAVGLMEALASKACGGKTSRENGFKTQRLGHTQEKEKKRVFMMLYIAF